MGFLSRYFHLTERLSPIFGKKNVFGVLKWFFFSAAKRRSSTACSALMSFALWSASSSWGFLRSEKLKRYLVGGFNIFEKYWSNWIISPSRGENLKKMKPPPGYVCCSKNLQNKSSILPLSREVLFSTRLFSIHFLPCDFFWGG